MAVATSSNDETTTEERTTKYGYPSNISEGESCACDDQLRAWLA